VVRQIKTLATFMDKLGGAKRAGAEKLRRDALTEIADALVTPG
jgi:hypothetical protein